MLRKWFLFVVTLGVIGALSFFLLRMGQPDKPHGRAAAEPLLLYCAAGIKGPVEKTVRDFEQAFGVRIQLQFGGSGTLLSNIRIAHCGDLFLAGDAGFIENARRLGLIDEVIPLAFQQPVVVVRKGNPKNIRALHDLWRTDVRLELANPEATSIGRAMRDLFRKSGQWPHLEKRVAVFKPTVNDIANDVRIGTVDAGIVWDATARQHPDLEVITIPSFSPERENISIAVLKSSTQPTAALRFARYLGAADKGLLHFRHFGYQPVEGDPWADTPGIVLFSGAMLRPGIETTLKEFETREGCRITTVYNGCGILTAQMRTGERPDGYFSCDTSFMNSVADLYIDPVDVVDNHLMIIVQRGNPQGIRTVNDLSRPGLRVGLPHHDKSAMGHIAWKMLKQMGMYQAVQHNLKVESPTGDFLINQIRTGSLDAIIACRSNHATVAEFLDAIAIDHPLARMTQPYAVGRSSRYKQMMMRLQDALVSEASQQRFESVGFGWRYQATADSVQDGAKAR